MPHPLLHQKNKDAKEIATISDSLEVFQPQKTSRLLITCPHASNAIPTDAHDLGLTATQKESHRGFDPGAATLARKLATALDAQAYLGTVSRLYIELNRKYLINPTLGIYTTPSDLVPAQSDFLIPGNTALSIDDYHARTELHRMYHVALHQEIHSRIIEGQTPVLVDVHSCTPEPLNNQPRDFVIGLIGAGEAKADSIFVAVFYEEIHQKLSSPSIQQELRHHYNSAYAPSLSAVDWNKPLRWNEPYNGNLHYRPKATTMMPMHALITAPLLDYINIEVRHDFLTTPKTADIITSILCEALASTLANPHVQESLNTPRQLVPQNNPEQYLAPVGGASGPLEPQRNAMSTNPTFSKPKT